MPLTVLSASSAMKSTSPSRRSIIATPPLVAAAASLHLTTMASSASAVPPQVPKIELAPGLAISRIIKGCWQLSGGHGGDRPTDRTSGNAAVEDFQPFVNAGITTFDTADIYGPSESLIGSYLKSSPDAKAKCQVLTKFCCFGTAMNKAQSLSYVEQCIDKSRKALGVDQLDLVQFYWHDYNNKNYVAASLHLAELQAKGKIKHIGVTNFDVARLSEMVDAGANIVSNQIQYSLLDRRPENGMSAYCKQHNIGLLPYGTVAGGFLTEKYLGLPAGKVNVNTYSLSKYASVINTTGGYQWLQNLLQALKTVADKHQVGIGEVASRWVLDQPQVTAVIVGARNSLHVAQHQGVFGFELDGEDVGRINEVLVKGAKPTSDCYTWERGGAW